jgi:predicted ester cyclase
MIRKSIDNKQAMRFPISTREEDRMSDAPVTTLARDFFASQDRRRGGPDPALCTADYTAAIGGHAPMPLAGHEGFAVGFYAGFPDAAHTLDDVFAAGDRLAVRFTIRGTHTGSFFGIPATGRPITVVANIMMQVRDGRVARLTGVFDEAGLLRQIGVLPA